METLLLRYTRTQTRHVQRPIGVARGADSLMNTPSVCCSIEGGQSVPAPSRSALMIGYRGKIFTLSAVIFLWGARAMAADGLITIPSSFGPKDTMVRLEAEVRAKGLTVFAHVDHAAGAAAVGLTLQPTDLLIFGNAKGGTPLMQSVQTIGIDLPLKVLVWQDAAGKTWLSYNDPAWLAKRHSLPTDLEATVKALSAMLKAVTAAATAPN
jgi:uncharacterized protein (DUF302 family)